MSVVDFRTILPDDSVSAGIYLPSAKVKDLEIFKHVDSDKVDVICRLRNLIMGAWGFLEATLDGENDLIEVRVMKRVHDAPVFATLEEAKRGTRYNKIKYTYRATTKATCTVINPDRTVEDGPDSQWVTLVSKPKKVVDDLPFKDILVYATFGNDPEIYVYFGLIIHANFVRHTPAT